MTSDQDAEQSGILLDRLEIFVSAAPWRFPSAARRQRRRHLVRLGLGNRHRDRLDQVRARRRSGVPEVPCHHDHAAEHEHAAETSALRSTALDRDQAVDETDRSASRRGWSRATSGPR